LDKDNDIDDIDDTPDNDDNEYRAFSPWWPVDARMSPYRRKS